MNLTCIKAGTIAAIKLLLLATIAFFTLYILFFALGFIACLILLKTPSSAELAEATEETIEESEIFNFAPEPILLLTPPIQEQKATENKSSTNRQKSRKTKAKTETKNPLELLTKAQLQRTCKERKLKGYSKLSKNQLIDLLSA